MENRFHWLDYVIFVGMLLASLGIGLWHAWKGQRKKTTEEYLMGGRELQVYTVSIFLAVLCTWSGWAKDETTMHAPFLADSIFVLSSSVLLDERIQ